MTGAHIFLTPSLYHWTWSSTLDSQRTLERLLVKSFGEWWRSDQIPGLQSRTLCIQTTLMSSHRKEIHTNPNSPSRVSLLVVPSYLGGKGKSHLILLCLVCSQQSSRGDSCSHQPMLRASLFLSLLCSLCHSWWKPQSLQGLQGQRSLDVHFSYVGPAPLQLLVLAGP